MPKAPKRTNKTKEELKAAIAYKEKVEREKSLCKLMWPFLTGVDTIFDAQTALNAAAGYINYGMARKIEEAEKARIDSLGIDMSSEPDSKIKSSVAAILGLVGPEGSKDTAGLLERFGKTLAMYGSQQYLKNPMKKLPMKDIIA